MSVDCGSFAKLHYRLVPSYPEGPVLGTTQHVGGGLCVLYCSCDDVRSVKQEIIITSYINNSGVFKDRLRG